MDHQLSQARQRAAIALARERQRIVDTANQELAELNEAEKELAATYAAGAGLDGDWMFANDDAGAVVLRKVEKEEPADAEVPTPSA